jgi:hypothetical protein
MIILQLKRGYELKNGQVVSMKITNIRKQCSNVNIVAAEIVQGEDARGQIKRS